LIPHTPSQFSDTVWGIKKKYHFFWFPIQYLNFLIPHIVNGFLSFFGKKIHLLYGFAKKRAVRVSVNGFRGDTRQPKKFGLEKKCGKNVCKWFSGRHSCCSFEFGAQNIPHTPSAIFLVPYILNRFFFKKSIFLKKNPSSIWVCSKNRTWCMGNEKNCAKKSI